MVTVNCIVRVILIPYYRWVWCSCSPDLDYSQCWRVGYVGAGMSLYHFHIIVIHISQLWTPSSDVQSKVFTTFESRHAIMYLNISELLLCRRHLTKDTYGDVEDMNLVTLWKEV